MIWSILVGFVVGVVAKLLMPGKDPGGFIITILLGIAGSFVSTWLGAQLGYYEQGQPAGFVASVFGAILILIAYRFIIGRKR